LFFVFTPHPYSSVFGGRRINYLNHKTNLNEEQEYELLNTKQFPVGDDSERKKFHAVQTEMGVTDAKRLCHRVKHHIL
jgi:hypothetical protein